MGVVSISPLIFKLSTRWRWVFSFTYRPLYLRGIAVGTNWLGRWGGPRANVDAEVKRHIFCPVGNWVKFLRSFSLWWSQHIKMRQYVSWFLERTVLGGYTLRIMLQNATCIELCCCNLLYFSKCRVGVWTLWWWKRYIPKHVGAMKEFNIVYTKCL